MYTLDELKKEKNLKLDLQMKSYGDFNLHIKHEGSGFNVNFLVTKEDFEKGEAHIIKELQSYRFFNFLEHIDVWTRYCYTYGIEIDFQSDISNPMISFRVDGFPSEVLTIDEYETYAERTAYREAMENIHRKLCDHQGLAWPPVPVERNEEPEPQKDSKSKLKEQLIYLEAC